MTQNMLRLSWEARRILTWNRLEMYQYEAETNAWLSGCDHVRAYRSLERIKRCIRKVNVMRNPWGAVIHPRKIHHIGPY